MLVWVVVVVVMVAVLDVSTPLDADDMDAE
jgi:hypothetical protein